MDRCVFLSAAFRIEVGIDRQNDRTPLLVRRQPLAGFRRLAHGRFPAEVLVPCEYACGIVECFLETERISG